MKIAVILNGISLAKSRFYHDILPVLKKAFTCDVFETQSRNDAVALASRAVARRYDVILAAGGDGTLHQVINGMLKEYEPPTPLPVVGILTLGSGNDFSRTLQTQDDINSLIVCIRERKTKIIDIGQVEYTKSKEGHSDEDFLKRHFINVVDVGMGPEVVRRVTSSGRAFGSAFSYYQSILSTFFTYKPVVMHAKSEDWEWHGRMRTFAVANGKYYGNGLCIAPDAKPDDGVLDIFACGGVSVLDFILQSIPLKKGKKIRHPQVSYFKGKEIRLWSDEPVAIEADGELLGWLPATVRLDGPKVEILWG